MKAFFLSLIFIFCTWSLFFIGKGVDNLDITAERYKRALDAGANAAAQYRDYDTGDMLVKQGTGYGIGSEDRINASVDKEEAIKWFYRVFFRNLGISGTEEQEDLKRYIPMKAVILYDRLLIADEEDNWDRYGPEGREYIIEYGGRNYKFTLSEQVYDINGGRWIMAENIGLSPEERKALVTRYIINELNSFLKTRANKESGRDYEIVFSLDDAPEDKLSGINGVNFFVLCEGIPIPSLNPFKPDFFFACGVGGSEISR